MSDLIQYVEMGDQVNSGPIAWRGDPSPTVVPASNRTRIIDRENANGYYPGEDGWLSLPRYLGCICGRIYHYGGHEEPGQYDPTCPWHYPTGGDSCAHGTRER